MTEETKRTHRCACYKCTQETFRPMQLHPARWLDLVDDEALIRESWGILDDAAYQELLKAFEEDHHQPAGIIEDGRIVAHATIMRYSNEAWELAAVWVDEANRGKGYGKSICSFVTAAILDAGRLATCRTSSENIAMRRTQESIGYQYTHEEGG
jgi:predicted GNAT family acetyltransferase